MELLFKNSELKEFAKLSIPIIDYDQDMGWAWLNKIKINIKHSIFSVDMLIDARDIDFNGFLDTLVKMQNGITNRAQFYHLEEYFEVDIINSKCTHPYMQIFLTDKDSYFIIFKIRDYMSDGDFRLTQVLNKKNIADLTEQLTALQEETKKYYENKH